MTSARIQFNILITVFFSFVFFSINSPLAAEPVVAAPHPEIAIMPFANLSSDSLASDKFRRVMEHSLWNAGYNSFTPTHLIEAYLDSQEVSLKGMEAPDFLTQMAENLHCKAALFCTVHDYSTQRTMFGVDPVVSVSIRLFDCLKGELIFQKTLNHSGLRHASLFGINRIYSLTDLAHRVASNAVNLAFVRNPGLSSLLQDHQHNRNLPQPESQDGLDTNPSGLRLAVLPPINYSAAGPASKMMEELLNCHLFNETDHTLLPSADVSLALLKSRIRDINAMSPGQIQDLCRLMNADVLVYSNIIEFEDNPDKPNNIGVVLSLAGRDGVLFYKTTRARGSMDYKGIFAGREVNSMSRIMSDLCISLTRDIIRQLTMVQPQPVSSGIAQPLEIDPGPTPSQSMIHQGLQNSPRKVKEYTSPAAQPDVPDSLAKSTQEIAVSTSENTVLPQDQVPEPVALRTSETALRSRQFFNQLLQRMTDNPETRETTIQRGMTSGINNNLALQSNQDSTKAIFTRYSDSDEAGSYTRILTRSLQLNNFYQTAECQLLKGKSGSGAIKLFMHIHENTVYMKSSSVSHLLASLWTLLEALELDSRTAQALKAEIMLRTQQAFESANTGIPPTNPPTSTVATVQAMLLADTGDRLFQLGDYDRSKDFLLRAREQGVDTPELQRLLASIFRIEGNLEKAVSFETLASSASPRLETMARVDKPLPLSPEESIRNKKPLPSKQNAVNQYGLPAAPEGPDQYRQKIKRKPGIAWHQHLIRGALKSGNLAMARTKVSEALEMHPDHGQFRSLQQKITALFGQLTNQLQILNNQGVTARNSKEIQWKMMALRQLLGISPLPDNHGIPKDHHFDFETSMTDLIHSIK